MPTIIPVQQTLTQLSLFSEETKEESRTTIVPVTIPKPVKKTEPVKSVPDEGFFSLLEKVNNYAENNDLQEIFRMGEKNGFINGGANFRFTNNDSLKSIPYRLNNIISTVTFQHFNENAEREKDDCSIITQTVNLIHLSKEGEAFYIPVEFKFKETDVYCGNWNDNYKTAKVLSIKVGKAGQIKKFMTNALFVQNHEEIKQIILASKPYLEQYLNQKEVSIHSYILAPWLEILHKADFTFALLFIEREPENISSDEIVLLNRLAGPGTKPKTIFKTERCVYECLKHCGNLNTWDVYRRLAKTGKINKDTIRQVYERNFNERELNQINSILAKEHNGKKVFSWESLINYLGRLDMYEAIDAREALVLLQDYLSMCSQLGMEPRIDGDSLKREHDIAARLIRQRRDDKEKLKMEKHEEEVRKQIEEGKSRLSRCDYSEGVYTVKRITDYDDLIDEARQQHNCVASYTDRITSDESVVCTLRETKNPSQSLVTIELSPDLKTIRQKYLAYNQQIRNKSITEFIERWHKQILA